MLQKALEYAKIAWKTWVAYVIGYLSGALAMKWAIGGGRMLRWIKNIVVEQKGDLIHITFENARLQTSVALTKKQADILASKVIEKTKGR